MRQASTWCMRRSAWVMAIATSTLVLFGLIASAGQVDPTPEVYLQGTPGWEHYLQIDEEYEIGETLIIALRELGGTVFDVETISAVSELDRVISGLDEVDRVLSLGTATVMDKNGDLRTLLPDEPVTRDIAIDLAKRIRKHPVYGELLVDDHHESTYVFVRLAVQLENPIKRIQVVRKIRAEVERFAAKHRSVHLVGGPATKEALATSVQHDILLFFPAVLILLVILLWIMFNSLIASLVPLAVAGAASILVLGMLSVFGVAINMTTASVPIVILVVGVANSVHFLAELRRQYARTQERKVALVDTVEAIAVPSALGTAAATAGFLALVFSGSVPLRQFGCAAALGLWAEHAGLLLLMPVLFKIFRYPKKGANFFVAAPFFGRLVGRIAAWGHRHMPLTIGIAGLLVGGTVAAVSQLRTDADFVNFLDEQHVLRQDLEIIERTLGGTDIIEVIVSSKTDDTFKKLEGLKTLEQLGRDLRNFEGVSRIFSLADYLKLTNAVLSSNKPLKEGRLPKTPEKVAQLALLDPSAFSALTDRKMRQARVTLQVRAMPSESILKLSEQARIVAEASLEGTGLEVTFTGRAPLFARIVRQMLRDAGLSFLFAALLIGVAMYLGLRSPGIALACVASNIFAVGLTVAVMAILGMRFDTSSIFIVGLGISSAVCATMHIAARYQHVRKGSSPEEAIQSALTEAGHPMLMGALILWAGFMVLCLSSFRPTFRVGLLSVLLLSFSVVLDLLLFPVLLVTVDRLEKEVRRGRTVGAGSAKSL